MYGYVSPGFVWQAWLIDYPPHLHPGHYIPIYGGSAQPFFIITGLV
jgi:hypothetical protein